MASDLLFFIESGCKWKDETPISVVRTCLCTFCLPYVSLLRANPCVGRLIGITVIEERNEHGTG